MSDINPQSGTPVDLRGKQTGAATGQGGSNPQKTGSSQGAGQAIQDKFYIPDSVKSQYPDLIPLIIGTESMNDEERQYWFQILPIMTEEQVVKLREILANEKRQLQKLDSEYQEEVKSINKKHVSEWKAFEAKEKREKLHSVESAAEKKEKAEEEEMLKKLQGL